MSKLYGYLEGDSGKVLTKASSKCIESNLQTSFIRTKTIMDDTGTTYISAYKCYGNDNVGELLSEVKIMPDGEVRILISPKQNP